MNDWTFVVEFEPLAAQYERDPENAFPNDECTRFVQMVFRHWDLEPGDPESEELMQWTETTVTLHPEVLDHLAEPLAWLLMHSIPYRLELTR